MPNWTVGLLVAGGALAMVLFTWLMCRSILQIDEVLARWARQRGFRIIRSDGRTRIHPWLLNPYRQVYRLVVEDQEKRQKKGWVSLGEWWIIGFTEHIEERWEDS